MKYWRVIAGLLVAVAASGRAAEPGFVGISGDQFVYGGQVHKLKGTNYYPKNHMWASMWTDWNWAEIMSEAVMIRDLGMNCVRILVPYSLGGWNGPNVPEDRLMMLENLVNMLGEKGIRSCITVFDWETSYPASGTSTETNHYAYLTTIVNRFKSNRYVFMWDVKNEPDHPDSLNGYDDWDYAPSQKAKIMSWLQRMCAKVRSLDANHPVSVGFRWYSNLIDCVSWVDIAIFHSYWPTIGSVQIPAVKAATGKPVLIQEFGWPSWPPTYPDRNETDMQNVYALNINAFIQHGIAGGLQWMTFDERAYIEPWKPEPMLFGLWRYDYTLKPAGEYYRDNYPVAMFPVEPDVTAPRPVSSFTATSRENSVHLAWTNPGNWDYAGVTIRCKTTGYPAGVTDGALVCDEPGSPGAADSFDHVGLTNGLTYYYAAFAHDHTPNYATRVTGYATPEAPAGGDTCGYARTLPDNASVSLNRKCVTAVFSGDGCIYVEEPDRTAGIRVICSGAGLAVGDRVNVSGKLATRIVSGLAAERQVATATVYKLYSAPPLMPVFINCRSIGGGPIPPCVPGVVGGFGLNSIGLLVTTVGRVTAVVSNSLYIDDGSNIQDFSGRIGICVKCAGPATVGVGDVVRVTGIVAGSVPVGSSGNRRFIQARFADDVARVD